MELSVAQALQLADTRHQSGMLDSAESIYRQVLAAQPDLVAVRIRLGFLCKQRGNFPEAIAQFRAAARLAPTHAALQLGLANALHLAGNAAEAIEHYRAAVRIGPAAADWHVGLGSALLDLRRPHEAADAFRQALAIATAPLPIAHTSLAMALIQSGDIAAAAAELHRYLESFPQDLAARSQLLLALSMDPATTPAAYRAEAEKYGAIVAGLASRFAHPRVTADARDAGPLRVGIVSGEINRHPVGFFLENLVAHSDPARVQWLAYPTSPVEDELSERVREYFVAWQPLTGLDDGAAARRIHDDRLDILLDLSGHTRGNRLAVFAWKPAPVQASWLGYWASTGVAEIDFLLVDRDGVHDDELEQYGETPVFLPATRLCFAPPVETRECPVAPLPALQNGHITFGCFQRTDKLNDGVLSAWSKILAALPSARLRIQSTGLASREECALLQSALAQAGIPAGRVALLPPARRVDYLDAYAQVDLLLDTFPFPGGTTTCEALWMGVPTLALAGNNLLSRQGAALMRCVGLDDWVASDVDDYIRRAVALATDVEALARLRTGLRERTLASPLMNGRQFAQDFTDALFRMRRDAATPGPG